MPRSSSPDEFREQLSAWHDGALPGEASRFVLGRALQDESLRAELGRWQVIGDVLQRRSLHAPVTDVPRAVADRLAAAEAEAGTGRGRRVAAGRWWATAAAVGLAAVLLAPLSGTFDAAPDAGGVDVALATQAAGPVSPVAAPVVSVVREAPTPLVAAAMAPPRPSLQVPPLVRAPQPTPEQLAPLPAIDAPVRPWPRSTAGEAVYAVDYALPAGEAPRQ